MKTIAPLLSYVKAQINFGIRESNHTLRFWANIATKWRYSNLKKRVLISYASNAAPTIPALLSNEAGSTLQLVLS